MHKLPIYKQEYYAEEYDEERYGGAFGQYLHDLELSTFLSLMGSSYKNVLDVGAGTGKLCIPLSLKSERVVAVDFSTEMINVAIRKAEKRNIKLNMIVCDAQRLCFKDKTFDCVISSRLLMHLSDWRAGIRELSRVSKEALIFDLPSFVSFAGIDSLFKIFKKLIKAKGQTYNTFFIKDVASELQSHNFKIIKLRRQFSIPIYVHRRLNNPGISKKIEKFIGKFGISRLVGSTVVIKAVRNAFRH